MGFQLHGTTTAWYGNSSRSQTLAGGTLIFYRYRERVAAKAARFGWYPQSELPPQRDEIGRAEVASDGRFDATLEADRGEPLLVALEVKKLDYAPVTGKSARGVLGVGVPALRESQEGLVGVLDIDLAQPSYCALLGALDLWLVSGKVLACDPANPASARSPIEGATVVAYDRDITEDDTLGSATTDATGSFEVFVDKATFWHVPLLPAPWNTLLPFEIGGPDVFFLVQAGAAELLREPAERGRTRGRENVPHCFYEELCVPVRAPEGLPTVWTHIGNYQVKDSLSLHDFDSHGLALHPGLGKLAFAGAIPLRGSASDATGVEYRFVLAEWSNPLSDADADRPALNDVNYRPLTAAQIVTSGGGANYGVVYVALSGGGYSVQPVFPEPDSQGWIRSRPVAGFVPNGLLARVDTSRIASDAYSTATAAGSPLPVSTDASKPHPHARKVTLYLQEKTGGVVTTKSVPIDLHVSNTAAVLELDVELGTATLAVSPCGQIPASSGPVGVHARYTIAHPYMGAARVRLARQTTTGEQELDAEDLVTTATFYTDAAGRAGTADLQMTTAEKCSYRVWLTGSLRVTTGEVDGASFERLRTLCVG